MANRHEDNDFRVADGLSGGRQSIRARVLAVANEILSLLDELHLDSSEPNAAGIDQLRARIRSGLTELVGELTVGGGPRVRRIDDIFTLLLERMSQLQDQLPDEGDTTHFPAIADQMASVYRSWNNMQQLFGVQTTIVAKQLGLAADAVADVRFAMNSASLGAAERQIAILRFDAPGLADEIREQEPMSVENLLDWVETFASEGGPRALSEDGGFALEARIAPAAIQLAELVRAAIDAANPGSIPRKSRTPLVERSMVILAGRLDEVAWNC